MDARLLLNNVSSERYRGRPFLRLIECYVLWAIDRLPEDYGRALEEMTPKLQETFGSTGSWQQIVAHEVDLSDEVHQGLRSMWQRNSELAAQNGTPLDAEAWVREVVDRNFV